MSICVQAHAYTKLPHEPFGSSLVHDKTDKLHAEWFASLPSQKLRWQSNLLHDRDWVMLFVAWRHVVNLMAVAPRWRVRACNTV